MKRVLKNQLLWLNTLYEIVRDVNSTLSLKNALKTIVTKATTLLKVERASLMLLDPTRKFLTIHSATGLSPSIIRSAKIKVGQGVSGWVAQKGKPLLIQDISKDKRFTKKEKGRYSTDSLLSVPLKAKGKTIGVLNVNNKKQKAIFTQADLKLLTALADEAAIAIQNAKLYEELVQANERLKELDKLKSGFVANVSHELRTPLAIIRNFIFAFQQEIGGTVSGRQKDYLARVEDNLGRLERLIDNLLDLSKMEAGRFELRKARSDLLSIAKKVTESLQKKGEEKGVRLEFSAEPVPSTYLDQDRVTEVVTNLVDNAIKYTPRGGSVTVGLKKEDGGLLLSVQDTGIGIKQKDQEKLFEKFRQFGASPHKEKGVGLGLAIAKEIVELHHGKIRVASEEGKGSTFVAIFPILSDEAFFVERLSIEIQKAREKGDFLSLVVLGLSNFEEIKKRVGESETENVLNKVAGIVKETVRQPSDIVASYKQGRVIAILAGAHRKGAQALAERVRESVLAHPFAVRENSVPIELQFGIATFPEDGENQGELIRKAEKALQGHR